MASNNSEPKSRQNTEKQLRTPKFNTKNRMNLNPFKNGLKSINAFFFFFLLFSMISLIKTQDTPSYVSLRFNKEGQVQVLVHHSMIYYRMQYI